MKDSRLIASKYELYLKKDEQFAEYFNDFLLSPAFSKKLFYDNDVHIMTDVSLQRSLFSKSNDLVTKPGNLKKRDVVSESRALIKWSKENRLPFFLKSKQFLEYKLCKYLLHGKDCQQLSAMSITAFAIEDGDEDDETEDANSPDKAKRTLKSRPDSNTSTKSWPVTRDMDEYGLVHSRATSAPSFPFTGYRASSANLITGKGKQLENLLYKKIASAFGEDKDFARKEENDDFEAELTGLCLDDMDGRISMLEFENDGSVDENQAESEMKDISMKRKLTLQELKRESLGSMEGMDSFKDFLHETSGYHLLQFWLDTEHYKDRVAGWEDAPEKKRQFGLRLFRLIKDRYKQHLTKDAQEQINNALENEGFSEYLFLNAQADMLCRLKYYWLPRFLVHLERQHKVDGNFSEQSPRLVSSMSFFPSLCVVRSLPTLGHVLSEEARERSFTSLYKFRGNFSRITSGYIKKEVLNIPENSTAEDPLRLALNAEKESGFPFLAALKKQGEETLLKVLQFWLDVDDFIKQNDKKEDRLYRVYSAWNIFNTYINDANYLLSHKKEVVERVRLFLTEAREITKEAAILLFSDLQIEAEEELREIWLGIQAMEVEKLEKATKNATPIPTQHHAKKVVVSQELQYSPSRWVKRYPGSSDSERRVRLHTALSMADDCNFSRLSSRGQLSEKAEPVKKRKKKKKKKGVKFSSEENESTGEGSESSPKKEEKLQLSDFMENKDVLNAFKHHIQNEEGRDAFNNLSMLLDIEAYNDIHPAKKLSRQQHSSTIYRTYFDPGSRRAVRLPEEVVDKVEDELPTTPMLLEAKYSVLHELESSFQSFYKKAQHKLNKEILAAASELGRMTSDVNSKPDTMESLRTIHSHMPTPKAGKKKRKGTGRANPTKEDRTLFLEEVHACAGRLSDEMQLFRKYLIVKEEPGAFPRLEKDLLFYIEVQKFKDLYPFLDETALNRKVEVIIDVFLDSATPPWLQVDLNQEQAGKAIQKASQYYSMAKRVPREQKDPYLFDDAQAAILKEILPYWAGYCKQFRDSTTPPEFPMTKKEREQMRRRKELMKMTNAHSKLCDRPKTPGYGESKNELTFTFGRGFKWKEAKVDLESLMSESTASGSRRSSPVSVNAR
ncbi:uncharacterized protein LOC135681805 [Rhopilema esculentum]|uniref:uncharacterized protein LOC135681805 n=1 Tax=Rhopilema esculentum TaxID=499914 RepID=UPI0031D3CD2B